MFVHFSVRKGGIMDRYLTTSEARQKFLNLVDEVEDGDQVIITKRGVPKAVIVNFEQLQTLRAVARLWQDPEALKAMRTSLDEVKQGRTLKLSGAPTVDRILTAARKKGLLRG
jgi:prevent-host-death family protein